MRFRGSPSPAEGGRQPGSRACPGVAPSSSPPPLHGHLIPLFSPRCHHGKVEKRFALSHPARSFLPRVWPSLPGVWGTDPARPDPAQHPGSTLRCCGARQRLRGMGFRAPGRRTGEFSAAPSVFQLHARPAVRLGLGTGSQPGADEVPDLTIGPGPPRQGSRLWIGGPCAPDVPRCPQLRTWADAGNLQLVAPGGAVPASAGWTSWKFHLCAPP